MSKDMPAAQRRRIDAAILGSLATWFRMREQGWRERHAFNDGDMADLMERMVLLAEPRPMAVAPKED